MSSNTRKQRVLECTIQPIFSDFSTGVFCISIFYWDARNFLCGRLYCHIFLLRPRILPTPDKFAINSVDFQPFLSPSCRMWTHKLPHFFMNPIFFLLARDFAFLFRFKLSNCAQPKVRMEMNFFLFIVPCASAKLNMNIYYFLRLLPRF